MGYYPTKGRYEVNSIAATSPGGPPAVKIFGVLFAPSFFGFILPTPCIEIGSPCSQRSGIVNFAERCLDF